MSVVDFFSIMAKGSLESLDIPAWAVGQLFSLHIFEC